MGVPHGNKKASWLVPPNKLAQEMKHSSLTPASSHLSGPALQERTVSGEQIRVSFCSSLPKNYSRPAGLNLDFGPGHISSFEFDKVTVI
jgi:hypothetical protein